MGKKRVREFRPIMVMSTREQTLQSHTWDRFFNQLGSRGSWVGGWRVYVYVCLCLCLCGMVAKYTSSKMFLLLPTLICSWESSIEGELESKASIFGTRVTLFPKRELNCSLTSEGEIKSIHVLICQVLDGAHQCFISERALTATVWLHFVSWLPSLELPSHTDGYVIIFVPSPLSIRADENVATDSGATAGDHSKTCSHNEWCQLNWDREVHRLECERLRHIIDKWKEIQPSSALPPLQKH